MLGRFNIFRYNVAFWSLVQEMRISLLFPIIGFLARWVELPLAFVVAACCTIASSLSFLYLENTLPGEVRMTGYSYTLSFCGIFLLGAVLAKRWQHYSTWLAEQSTSVKSLLVAVALFLYLYSPTMIGRVDIGDFLMACGAALILLFGLVRLGSFSRFLRAAPNQFLGRISYSLYLLHYPVLLVLAYTKPERVPFVLLLTPYLALSLALAALAYRIVELPAIALGRRLAPTMRNKPEHAAQRAGV